MFLGTLKCWASGKTVSWDVQVHLSPCNSQYQGAKRACTMYTHTKTSHPSQVAPPAAVKYYLPLINLYSALTFWEALIKTTLTCTSCFTLYLGDPSSLYSAFTQNSVPLVLHFWNQKENQQIEGHFFPSILLCLFSSSLSLLYWHLCFYFLLPCFIFFTLSALLQLFRINSAMHSY